MGKKKRIMTSGQKFVKKHRKFMQTLGDPLLRDDDLDAAVDETGDASEIDMPGQKPFISALDVTDRGGQVVTFKALVENTAGLAVGETIQVTLDGTDLPVIAMDNIGSEETDTTVDGQTQKKGIVAWPVSAVPFAANGVANATAIYGSDWLAADRVLLSAAATPGTLSAGSHTLKVAVVSNSAARFTKTKKFTVAATKVTFADGDAAFVAKNGADDDNLDVNLGAGAGPSGIAAGDKTAWALANNKYQIEVTTSADTSTNLALATGGTGGRGHLTQKAGQAANTLLTVLKGGAGITNILADDVASTELVVTITPFNKKGQLDTGSAVSKTISTGAGA